jgi:hypothetical protein
MTADSDPELKRLQELERQQSARYERLRGAIDDESALAAARKLRDEASAAVRAYLSRR